MTRLPKLLYMAAALGLLACASVLGIRPTEERPFEHRAHVISGVPCVQCHGDMRANDATRALALPKIEVCTNCHADPHNPAPCMTCHGQPARRPALQAAKEHLRFSHAVHDGVTLGACVRCHGGIAKGDERLRPTMATCFTCHEHQEQWDSRKCDDCHLDMEAEQTRPMSHVVHGDNFIDHHGPAAASARNLCSTCHSESSCAKCHGVNVAALPYVLAFDRVASPQLHRAGFASRHALEARAQPGLCMTCHSPSSCSNCHSERKLLLGQDPRASIHPAGWVGPPGGQNLHGREARRDPMACASCHGGSGEQLCVGCHRKGAVGGNPHPPGFTSNKRMSEAPCRHCHGGGL